MLFSVADRLIYASFLLFFLFLHSADQSNVFLLVFLLQLLDQLQVKLTIFLFFLLSACQLCLLFFGQLARKPGVLVLLGCKGNFAPSPLLLLNGLLLDEAPLLLSNRRCWLSDRHVLLLHLNNRAYNHLVLRRVTNLHLAVDTERDCTSPAGKHRSEDFCMAAEAARAVVYSTGVQELEQT